jgi:glucose/arabinose dehydrogenase
MRFAVPPLLLLLSALPVASMAQEPPPTVAVRPLEADPEERLEQIRLPEGFRISIYAEGVTGARSLALSPSGTLFVGTLGEFGKEPQGKVYAVRDEDGDGRAERVVTLLEGLNYPNGVAFRDGALYVAELSRILRYDNVEKDLANPPEPVVINDQYPSEYHHGWKYIAFGPDGRLYVPVGAPCNICVPEEPFGTITSIRPDGTDRRIHARGIRNTVGFAWHPETKELWFTDNGRDTWGNDRPPEELNVVTRDGQHFGYPWRYGRSLVDETFKAELERSGLDPSTFTPAALEFPAHNALLGIEFYTGKMFPSPYRGQLFVASHGSWNRDPPDGYRVYLVRVKDGRPVDHEVFASGWLQQEGFWGRPVDLEMLPDGSLLVSDDFAHVIYRITYGAPE